MPAKKDITAHRHKWVDLYKKSHGCSLCGYNRHPSALCFDRLPEYKDNSRSGGMYKMYDARVPLDELLDEISQCRVLCCNCHMECTHNKNERTRIVTHEQISIDFLKAQLYNFEINDHT